MYTSGAQALPIVSLVSFLVGLILAFIGAVQLAVFGAQIYVASLVGISMVRVMGAVMVGVVMSGRTGAAFAARLGTMQVNEEIDALVTFGFSPFDFLVLPRLIALVVMMPLLCLYADFMGIVGGLTVGVFMFDLSVMEYIDMTRESVRLQDFWVGLVHSAVFGIIIALAGCLRGMQCGRSASAVGDAATSAVVTAIVGIIVATAVITVLADILGI
jgi:phospholipid/cholesterol/gamma-HCH transport system permease protein